MGRYVFRLPDIGEGVAEAEIVAWHVGVGAMVAEDDPLVDVMTEKATVEIPSPRAGRVVAVTGEPGEKIRIGADLVVFEVEGKEEAQKPAAGVTVVAMPSSAGSLPRAGATADAAEHSRSIESRPPAAPFPASAKTEPAERSRPGGSKPLASPAVRRRAHERGIALALIPGSGPGGRVTQADLDAFGGTGKARAGAREGVEEIKVIGLRRVIAERMQQSKRHIPHYSYVEELDVTALEELRAHLNTRHGADRGRLTLLPFLIAALVRAVPRFPQVNALFDDEAGIVRRHAAVHVGVATQTANGLMVPVLRHAETLDLWRSAAEITRLSAAARDGKAARDELSGSTITITSLGALGGIVATPVINYPEVAIIGVNRIVERPVVRDGQIVIRKMMNLSSSFDHRVVDGWDAARFIQALKNLLEQPAALFIE
ncbi:MAG: dihydrolipoamide acetyltransferase family protein [Acetobacteraceae bacterium]